MAVINKYGEMAGGRRVSGDERGAAEYFDWPSPHPPARPSGPYTGCTVWVPASASADVRARIEAAFVGARVKDGSGYFAAVSSFGIGHEAEFASAVEAVVGSPVGFNSSEDE